MTHLQEKEKCPGPAWCHSSFCLSVISEKLQSLHALLHPLPIICLVPWSTSRTSPVQLFALIHAFSPLSQVTWSKTWMWMQC